jgi:hypothetical protein
MMKKAFLPLSIALAFGANAACADDDLVKFQEESRKIVKELATQLGGAMQKEMQAGGPVAAIKVCKDIGPAAASEISRKTGQRVARVSLKVRNPVIGSPDAWEQKVLLDFDKRRETENPANIEFTEMVSEPQGKYLRYMKAIPVQDVCVKCHGMGDNIAQPVKDALKAEYPHDKAVGYAPSEIRGAFSIKKPL